MATTPTPVPAPLAAPLAAPTPGFIQHWITFVKAHEKLAIIALAAVLAFHFYDKGIDAWVNHDKTIAAEAAAKVQADTVVTAQLQAQITELKATVDQKNQQLQNQIASQKIAVQKQQQADAQLTPSDLVARLAKLVNVPPAQIITSSVPNKVEFDDSAAVATAQQLELVPVLQAEVTNLNTIIANDATIIGKQNDLINQLNTDLKDEKTSHVKDVNELKAQNHKSWLNGFKWGLISGVTLGLVAHNAGF